MSTANFYTQKRFDLWACDDNQFTEYLCSCCNIDDEGNETDFDTWMEYDAETGKWICPICGYETDNPETEGGFNQSMYLDWGDELERELNRFNDSLTFYTLQIKPGYYLGVQIYMEHENDVPEDLDNYECRYYFDMNRSTAIRRHKSEVNKINRYLARTMPEYGLQQLVLGGIFSNGEAVYYPANSIKAATI